MNDRNVDTSFFKCIAILENASDTTTTFCSGPTINLKFESWMFFLFKGSTKVSLNFPRKKIGTVDIVIKWVPIYSLDFISTHMINISIRTLIVSLLASLVAASVRGSAIQSLSVDPL